MYQIIHERPEDAAKIEPLLELCFGSARFEKTTYKIREKLTPISQLSLVAIEGDILHGTIRYWPLVIDQAFSALLLGPIAVSPDKQGEGIGIALIEESLKLAKEMGHKTVILVGDPDYYKRFGFTSAFDKGLDLPGPVDAHRFLVHELIEKSLSGVSGMVSGGELSLTQPGEYASAGETAALVGSLSSLFPPSETEKTQ
ncbi:MAG: N-acetyltransferase [Sneathiella sp.]|nr:N-acetyltransferase [Sneathiella sp.]